MANDPQLRPSAEAEAARLAPQDRRHLLTAGGAVVLGAVAATLSKASPAAASHDGPLLLGHPGSLPNVTADATALNYTGHGGGGLIVRAFGGDWSVIGKAAPAFGTGRAAGVIGDVVNTNGIELAQGRVNDHLDEFGSAGVLGLADGDATGVRGVTETGYAVHGVTADGTAVLGEGSTGVSGVGAVGVAGQGDTGVQGKSATLGGAGVRGENTQGTGVHGKSEAADGAGVRGEGKDGVHGRSEATDGHGIRGENTQGTGVRGDGKDGVHGRSEATDGHGIRGENDNGTGVAGRGTVGVEGSAPRGGIGVRGVVDAPATASAQSLGAASTDQVPVSIGVLAIGEVGLEARGTDAGLHVIGKACFDATGRTGRSNGTDTVPSLARNSTSVFVPDERITEDSIVHLMLATDPGRGPGASQISVSWLDLVAGEGFTVNLTNSAQRDVAFRYFVTEPC